MAGDRNGAGPQAATEHVMDISLIPVNWNTLKRRRMVLVLESFVKETVIVP